MNKGVVKFFHEDKGYGFIVNSDGSGDVFVHVSGLTDKKNKIRADDSVTFDIEEGQKGKNATNVKLA